MKKAVIGIAVGLVIVAMIITFGQVFTVRYIGVEFENSVSSTDKQEIVSLADIDSTTNIFVLDENTIKQRIESAFPDNVIRVTDVVREFPNKVTIKVSERIAIYKIEAQTKEEKGFVAVDRNFQRNTIYATEEELNGMELVSVKGFTVNESFVTEECYALRDIANSILAYSGEQGNSIPEEGIPYLIKEVVFDQNNITILLRSDDASLILDKTSDVAIKDQVRYLLRSYLETSEKERDGKEFSL